MPTLYRKVNDFRKPTDMFCGTRLLRNHDILDLLGLGEAAQLLGAFKGRASSRRRHAGEDLTKTLNLHETDRGH